ncbi:MAG: sugar phosphate isomerase/epimerase [Bacteroidia bacterium]|nr:sugar phosphate isomerase/epimerase [Bacteroidia bacterium]
MTTRRDFVKLAGVSALASIPLLQTQVAAKPFANVKRSFNIGIAGYTFLAYNNNIDKIIEVMNAIEVKNISLKNFQLPYESNKQQTDEVIGKFKAAGIVVYGLGVIYLKTEKEVDNAFSYAQLAGVKIIIAAPAYGVLSYVEKKAKEYNIKVAIHNHGPEDKLFPDIDKIFEKIQAMDPRMGICLDIGHSFRCGNDPAAMLLKYKDRIFDMHIKDVDSPVEKGNTVINGHGKMNFISFIKALDESGYSGTCSLEYEQKGDPGLGLAESVGHFRGMLTCAS